MKPRNWRTYYGYSRPAFTHAGPTKPGGNEGAYIEWLMAERGWSDKEAWAYCNAMDKRKLIRQETAPEAAPPPKIAGLRGLPKKPTAKDLAHILALVADAWRRQDDLTPEARWAIISKAATAAEMVLR